MSRDSSVTPYKREAGGSNPPAPTDISNIRRRVLAKLEEPDKKESNRKYRISSYGLTQEQFDRLLAVQQHAYGMCHELFEEGQLVHVDHDHACCSRKNPIVRRVHPGTLVP